MRYAILKLPWHLSAGNRPWLLSAALQAMEHGADDLVLDCSCVWEIDLSGLAFLVDLERRLANTSGDLVIAALAPHLQVLLDEISARDARLRFTFAITVELAGQLLGSELTAFPGDSSV